MALKVFKGSGNILLNLLLKKFLWALINFNLKSSLPSKFLFTVFDASNKIVTWANSYFMYSF